MAMKLSSPIEIRKHNYILGRVESCDFRIEKGLSNYRLSFSFHVLTNRLEIETSTLITDIETDLFFQDKQNSLLIGRLISSLVRHPIRCDGRESRVEKQLDISDKALVSLIDSSFRGDVVFEFNATPRFNDDFASGPFEKGTLKIPQSEWLRYLNNLGLERFELIAIRTPSTASQLHQPFSMAVEKIREAEREYTKGNWNAAAACCRAAWRTLLSATPPGQQALDHLLAKVVGDPKRKQFADVLAKGLHDALNAAAHLEGDVKTQTPPTNLEPEDALLCIHWYSAMIGYLASLQ